MFETLSEKLQRVFKNLRGEGRLTEQHIEEALKEIRMALLEADVNFKVVKQFTEAVKSKAIGEEVLQSLSPGQQVVKIVRDELIEILGGTNVRLSFASQPPTVIMLIGLQGSGKTTSSGKLAKWLERGGHRPILVSVDVYRPAAREQLKVIARDIAVKLWEGKPDDTPLQLCQDAVREARNSAHDVVIVDTAGRLHIDETLMKELHELKEAVHPNEILFVADAMLGQDAVKSAQQFHDQLGFSGFILTKMDGDARGGAALSIKQVTGQPVKDMQKVKVDEKELVRVEAIINSMTPKERRNHQLINGSRRKRIAKGSGTSVQQVNQLLKQYAQTRKMMKGMKNSFFGRRLKGMKLPEIPF